MVRQPETNALKPVICATNKPVRPRDSGRSVPVRTPQKGQVFGEMVNQALISFRFVTTYRRMPRKMSSAPMTW